MAATSAALASGTKGNSSYRGAPGELKRSLKLEFDDGGSKKRFFGLAKLNLNNNAFDPSDMRETLATTCSAAPASPPRAPPTRACTSRCRGSTTTPTRACSQIIEQIDQTFFVDRWGAKVGLLLKPEGLRGMPELGANWKTYEARYGARGSTRPADADRFMALVRFVNNAPDEEFAATVAQYVDVDEFIRFLASEVLIVNTDSPLAMNHNYWITMDPRSGKAVWLPWDMNMAFGGFGAGGIDLSVFDPASPGNFPLADRILSVPRYRQAVRGPAPRDDWDARRRRGTGRRARPGRVGHSSGRRARSDEYRRCLRPACVGQDGREHRER